MDKINSTEMNDLLANIDEIKSNYKMLLGKLMEISPGNTVLFTTKEEKDEFMKNVDVLEINSKISQDIINTLPILADFIDVQKKLSNIDDYLMKVCDAQYYLWLSINETDREKEEQRKACLENCLTTRSTFIGDIGWYAIKSQVPIYDNDNDRDAYMEIVYTDGESTEKWVDIWIDKFRRISRFEEKVSEFKKIRKFYGDIEQEFGRPDWLISLDVSNSLDYNSSFHMNGSETKEELMRIRELYISGKIKGVYTKYKDPKYAK